MDEFRAWYKSEQFYDPAGQPCDFDAWMTYVGNPEIHDVAADEVGNRFISTIYLGIDASLGRSPVPLIYETMVFPDCHYCQRTPNRAAAISEHDQAVAWAREKEERW